MYDELVCIDGVPPSIRHTTVPDHTDSLAHKPSKTTTPLIDPVVSALAVCGDRVTRPKHMAKVSKTEPPVRAISANPSERLLVERISRASDRKFINSPTFPQDETALGWLRYRLEDRAR